MCNETIGNAFTTERSGLLRCYVLVGASQARLPFFVCAKGIHNLDELKSATAEMLKTVDLKKKMKDFEHLLFNKENAARILRVGEFIDELK